VKEKLALIAIICLVSGLHAEEGLVRKLLSFKDIPFIAYGNDMVADGNYLYILENLKSTVYKCGFNQEVQLVNTFASRGEGPGEIYLPMELSLWAGQLTIKDERGFSFFGKDGSFLHRFMVFTPRISFVSHDERVYYATANKNSSNLIDVYEQSGKKVNSFFSKFLEIHPAESFKAANTLEMYFYGGKLLADGEFIYYLNTTFGRFEKFNLDGESLVRKDAADDFGPSGRYVASKNQDYLDNPFSIEGKNFDIYEMFQDACIFENSIYTLSQPYRAVEGEVSPLKNYVFVFDTNDLKLQKRWVIDLMDGDEIHSFVVGKRGDKLVIYAIIETNVDVQLFEFSQE